MAVQLREQVVCRRKIGGSRKTKSKGAQVIRAVGKLLHTSIMAILMIFMVWILASFMDINLHNFSPRSETNQTASWNAFELFVAYADNTVASEK